MVPLRHSFILVIQLLPGETSPNSGGYGCVAGTFKSLPFADQTFDKILDPLQTNSLKFSTKNTYPKKPENEFLAVNLCIFETISQKLFN